MTDGQASWGMGMVQAARQVLAKASAGVKDAAETIFGGELAEMEAVGEGEEAGCKSGRMSSEGTAAGLLGEAARNTGARDTAARAQSRQVASGLSRATGTGTFAATVSFEYSLVSKQRTPICLIGYGPYDIHEIELRYFETRL